MIILLLCIILLAVQNTILRFQNYKMTEVLKEVAVSPYEDSDPSSLLETLQKRSVKVLTDIGKLK